MDLGDLNIVAIAPTPKVQPTKRKKKNKYERRRQKAQRAKTQLEHHEDSVVTKEVEQSSLESMSQNREEALQNDVADEKASSTKEESPDEKSGDKTSTSPSNQNNINENESETKPQREKTSNEEQQRGSSATRLSETTSAPTSVSEDAKSAVPPTPTEADLEHAKYMAEFHARPMELDRRSGARSSASLNRASETSTHLFVEAADWESLPLHPRFIQTVTNKLKLTQPTTIQSQTIQAILADPSKQKNKKNKGGLPPNVLVHSETGSGKTLAYLLPILQHLGFDAQKTAVPKKRPNRKDLGTKAIILCPTRELASQTLTVLEQLCQANFAGWMVPGGLLGGDSRSSEKSRIRKGLALIVATPGRLLDHLNKTESLLMQLKGNLQWLILDEADRLLDMGLGDQVRQIVQLIRANEASKSQPWWRSVLVSATVTASVQALAQERMLCGDQSWVWVKGNKQKNKTGKEQSNNMGTNSDASTDKDAATTEEGYSLSTPRQLAQFHVTVTAKLRLSTLISFLVQRVSKGETTVVFMGTCACVDYHYQLFESMESLFDVGEKESEDATGTTPKGLFGSQATVFKLHGSIQHSRRNQTLKFFEQATKKSTTSKTHGAILLTTDVSARGLNLHGVHWTVQYDPPCEIADYVHRVGRVARAGKAGRSLLFLLPSEKGYLDVLQTKGISNLEPLSLADTLNQAAVLCPDWTNAGLKFGGSKEWKPHGGSKGDKPRKGSRMGEHFAGEVQRRLEDCIIHEDVTTRKKWKEQQKANKKRRKDGSTEGIVSNAKKEGALLELAREAFLSFLRAYPTKKEPSVRSIFSARALHLGHVARSFALKEPPKSLVSKHKQNQKATLQQEAADQEANLPKSLQFNAYENNLVSISDDDDDDDGGNSGDENSTDGISAPPSKRFKMQRLERRGGKKNDKGKNAKALLLENAMKMESNLMDYM